MRCLTSLALIGLGQMNQQTQQHGRLSNKTKLRDINETPAAAVPQVAPQTRQCHPHPSERLVRRERSVYLPAAAAAMGEQNSSGKRHHVSIDYRGQILLCTQHFQRDGVSKLRAISLSALVSSVSGRELKE